MKRVRRYYIGFNVKPAIFDPKTGRYARYVWPKLYESRDEAWRAIETLPIFRNSAPTSGRGRIISASVEMTRVDLETE